MSDTARVWYVISGTGDDAFLYMYNTAEECAAACQRFDSYHDQYSTGSVLRSGLATLQERFYEQRANAWQRLPMGETVRTVEVVLQWVRIKGRD